MRWLGQSQRAFDMLCERALSRYTHGSLLSDKQMVQDWIATSAAEMTRGGAGGGQGARPRRRREGGCGARAAAGRVEEGSGSPPPRAPRNRNDKVLRGLRRNEPR